MIQKNSNLNNLKKEINKFFMNTSRVKYITLEWNSWKFFSNKAARYTFYKIFRNKNLSDIPSYSLKEMELDKAESTFKPSFLI